MDSSQLEFNFERRNIKNVWRAGKLTDAEWKKLSLQWSKELKKYKIKSPQSFSWKKHKSFGNKTTAIIGRVNHNLDKQLKGFVTNGWDLANKKNNALASQYLKAFDLGTKEFPSMFNANIGAMNQFVNRSINGMNLSQNIWQHTNEAMDILESYVGTGIATGRPAKMIAKDVMQVLKNPNELPVPKGKYKSPYKNSMRMARTEVNMAYRQADHLRYKQLNFVTGIEVHLSGQHPKEDICDYMVGRYPKNFQFLGWHPHCFCYQTSVLASRKDFVNYLRGGSIPPSKFVTGLPKEAQGYLKKNIDRFSKYKTEPYWLANNRRHIARSIGKLPKQVTPNQYLELQAEKLMARAEKMSDEVYKLSKQYADEFGGVTTPVNLKQKDSILRKAKKELGGNVGAIKDSVRTTVIVEESQVEAVYKAMERNKKKFIRLKKQTPDKFMGYNGVLTNIETSSGLIGEIQVLSPEMIYAKMPPDDAIKLIGKKRFNRIKRLTGKPPGLGHKFYEDYRVLDKGIASQKKKMDLIWNQSDEYYSHFRQSTLPKIEQDALKLMDRAREVADDVYSLSVKYANKYGGSSTKINLKKRDSILRKARLELGGDVSAIKDSVRTTIIVEAEEVEKVMAAMGRDKTFIRIKHQTPDKFMGYNGVLTNIETRTGLIGEIQVLSPEMVYAKFPEKDAIKLLGRDRYNLIKKRTGIPGGRGHDFYEKYRILDKAVPEEKAVMDRLWKESDEYYSHFRGTTNKKPIFKKAKTLREAEVWAKENGIALRVDYSKATLEQANAVNKELAKVHRGSPLNKLQFADDVSTAKVDQASGIYNRETNTITINTNVKVVENESLYRRHNRTYWREQLDEWEEIYNYQVSEGKVTEMVKKKVDYFRDKVENYIRSFVEVSDMGGVIRHEYGHKLHWNNKLWNKDVTGNAPLSSRIAGKKESQIGERWLSAKRQTWFERNVSEYAATNPAEAFAESYVMYLRGDKLPTWLTDIIEQILKNAK